MKTLRKMLNSRPVLAEIKDVANITSNDDQLWEFWCSYIGTRHVVDVCKKNKQIPAPFSQVHEDLIHRRRLIELDAA